jgi:hypothetical protein
MHGKHRAPARHNVTRAALAAFALCAVIAAGALALGLLHIDHTGGTYGVSAGTDTAYCSVEMNAPGGHNGHGGGIDLWCQSGR